MARKSAEAMRVVAVTESARPAPPKDLTRKEKVIWRDILDSLPAEHLRSSDKALLANYCRLWTRADMLSADLASDPHNIDLDRMYRAAVASIAQLAVKLRLCPSSRIRAESASLKPKAKAKPWDNQRAS